MFIFKEFLLVSCRFVSIKAFLLLFRLNMRVIESDKRTVAHSLFYCTIVHFQWDYFQLWINGYRTVCVGFNQTQIQCVYQCVYVCVCVCMCLCVCVYVYVFVCVCVCGDRKNRPDISSASSSRVTENYCSKRTENTR